jgi:outer membrane protein OmpA-like peptidoglycan-associated protein
MKTILLIITIICLLQACGGIPDKNQLLEQARSTYAKAEAMPTAVEQKYTLAEAKIALTQAENANNVQDIKEFARIAIEKSKLAMSKLDEPTIKPKPVRPKPPHVAATSYKTQNGMAFILPTTTLFDENQLDLEEIPAIQQIAQFLQKNPQQLALIEGHTNKQGHSDFNYGLSYRQANAVRFALMRQGVASNRLIVKGLGSSRPLANNPQQSQRIQVTVSNSIQ